MCTNESDGKKKTSECFGSGCMPGNFDTMSNMMKNCCSDSKKSFEGADMMKNMKGMFCAMKKGENKQDTAGSREETATAAKDCCC